MSAMRSALPFRRGGFLGSPELVTEQVLTSPAAGPKLPPTKKDPMSRPPLHPGEVIADELAELGITPAELSRQIGVPPNRIARIIRGERRITGDTALRLGHWFGTSAEFWLNLQTTYELRVAAKEVGRMIARLPTRPERRMA